MPEPTKDGVAATARVPRVVVHWQVSWRRDRKSPWCDWGSYSTESQAREELARGCSEYAHYTFELRKITTQIEVVDADA